MSESAVRPTSGTLSFTLNGSVVTFELNPVMTVAALLRDRLGLTGTKVGCGVGECGSCTVLVDDAPVLSCLMLTGELEGRHVTTIESIGDNQVERMRASFLSESALQCGFCTPGMILTASRIPPDATDASIRAALVGNICRCTGYASIVRAVRQARSEGANGSESPPTEGSQA